MRIFISFSYHFFIIIWHFRSVFLSLIGLIVGTAAVITRIEKMPFEDALYFSFITGLTIGYGDIVVKTPSGGFSLFCWNSSASFLPGCWLPRPYVQSDKV